MKIKLFEGNDLTSLETSVNKFLKSYDERFIDVEFIPVNFTQSQLSANVAQSHLSANITGFKFFAMVKLNDKSMNIIF